MIVEHRLGGGNCRITAMNNGTTYKFIAALVHLSQSHPQAAEIGGTDRRQIERQMRVRLWIALRVASPTRR